MYLNPEEKQHNFLIIVGLEESLKSTHSCIHVTQLEKLWNVLCVKKYHFH